AAAAEDDGVRHRETEAGNGKREGRACPLIATSQARMHVREAESTGRTCFFPSSVSRSGSSTTRGRTLELALRVERVPAELHALLQLGHRVGALDPVLELDRGGEPVAVALHQLQHLADRRVSLAPRHV